MIYYLHEDPRECAKMLSDVDLEKQIRAIAQTLANVHQNVESGIKNRITYDNSFQDIDKIHKCKFTLWTSECRANYKKLVDMGLACCEEWLFRNNPEATYILVEQIEEPRKEKIVIMRGLTIEQHKLQPVIEWCAKSVPDLSLRNPNYPKQAQDTREFLAAPFPLVMPEEYYVFETDDAGKIANALVIDSYRNYYRAKMKKNVKCENCNGEGGEIHSFSGKAEHAGGLICPICNGLGKTEKFIFSKWTRRQEPEFLK